MHICTSHNYITVQNISIAWLLTSLCNFNLRCRNVENQNKEKGSEAEHCDEKNWISMSHDPDVFSWLFVWKLSRGGAWQLAVCSPFTVVNFVKRAIIDETWDPFVCNHALNWTSIPVPSERDQKWPRWGEEISMAMLVVHLMISVIAVSVMIIGTQIPERKTWYSNVLHWP